MESAITEIYTLSLHDALPISRRRRFGSTADGKGSPGRAGAVRGNGRRTSAENDGGRRSEEHTSELQSHSDLVCRLLLEKKKAFASLDREVLPGIALESRCFRD